jgi:hypothetical protein
MGSPSAPQPLACTVRLGLVRELLDQLVVLQQHRSIGETRDQAIR